MLYLYSKTIDSYYIGSTNTDVSLRIIKHNEKYYGAKNFSRQAIDWILILEIKCKNMKQASLIEHHIKKMKSKASFNLNLKRFFLNKLSADYTCNTVDCCVPTATLVHNLISPAS